MDQAQELPVNIPGPLIRWLKRWNTIWAAPLNDLPIRNEVVYEQMALDSSMDVLEVGAGSGYFAFDLHAWVGSVTILDIADQTVRRLKDLFRGIPSIRCEIGDICRNCPERQFNAVIGLEMFQYVSASDAALKNLGRLLRPGGQMLLQWPNYPALASTGPNSIASRVELDAMMRAAGFAEWSVYSLRLRPHASVLFRVLHEMPIAAVRGIRGAKKPTQSNFDQSWSASRGTGPSKLLIHSAWKVMMLLFHLGGKCFDLQPTGPNILGHNILLLGRK